MPTHFEDENAQRFAALVEPHFDRLFRLAYRLTGTPNDAEDLLQDVMVRLYEQRETLTDIVDLKPWLSRVLYNRFVDLSRARNRRPLTLVGDDSIEQSSEGGSTGDEPEESAITGETVERLERALARLSDDQQALLLLHDAEGYTLPEISAMTDTPLGTLKSRLSRARARLRELLHEWPENALPAAMLKKREPFDSEQRVGG